jgi:N-acetylmuramoyl-L-alanine amidase
MLVSPAVARSPNGLGCEPSKFRVVFDVGHTPEAPGATSSRGLTEYSFNLELASRAQEYLQRAGYDTDVVKTHGVGTQQLAVRTERANALHPQLIISLHHDATQARYEREWQVDGRKLSYSDKFSGFSVFVSRLNAHSRESLAFAELLSESLLSNGLSFSPHHAEDIDGERRSWADSKRGIYYYDKLFLLQHAIAPAVLLEAGVIVNRIEELIVGSDEGREAIASAIFSAVQSFCRAQT